MSAPWPASFANPDDPNGIWPAGAKIGNTRADSTYKFAFYRGVRPAAGDWTRFESHFGGREAERTQWDVSRIPRGAASARLMWLPNFSNRSGGYGAYPDQPNHQLVIANVLLREISSSVITDDGRRWVLEQPSSASASPKAASWIAI